MAMRTIFMKKKLYFIIPDVISVEYHEMAYDFCNRLETAQMPLYSAVVSLCK
jgi:hypothetical protein